MGIIVIIVGAIFFWRGFTYIRDAKDYVKGTELNPDGYKLIGSFLIIFAIGIISVGIWAMSWDTTSSTSSKTQRAEYTKTCPICHREFKDDANIKSIRLTNMCSNCYHNYETATEAGY